MSELSSWPVLLVAREIEGVSDFVGARHEVLAAPALLDALEVRWPPFYLLIAPDPLRVLSEGVAFEPAQVANELAEFDV